jgi:hypothetical protein
MLVRPYMYIVLYICYHYLISPVKVYYIRTTSSFLYIIVFICFYLKPMTLLFFTKHTVKKIDPSTNRIGGVMVSVLASRAIERGFEPRSGQIKDYTIGSCCFTD